MRKLNKKEWQSESIPLAVARIIREAIDRGEYKPGDKLPPGRLLAEHFGVSGGTIRIAQQQLRNLGATYSPSRKGIYVAGDIPPIKPGPRDRITQLEQRVTQLEEQLHKLLPPPPADTPPANSRPTQPPKTTKPNTNTRPKRTNNTKNRRTLVDG